MKSKLKDVCKIEKGKIGITKATKGEYPLVVTAEERLNHNEWHFDKPATIVPLVSSTGHGHASIKRLHYAEGKYAVGNILATLIPKDNKYLNAKYLYVYLTINKEELLVSQMTGAANVSLTLTKLGEVEIDVPNYDTQMKVIARYENSERYKNQMNMLMEKRSQLVEQLRHQILQDAITGKLSENWRKENLNKNTQNYELIPIDQHVPKGWNVSKLRDIAEFFNGKAHEPLVSETGQFILVNSKFVSNSGKVEVKRVKSRLTPLQKNDIAFVMSDVPNGRALARAILIEEDDLYTLNQRIAGFKVKEHLVIPKYLQFILDRNHYFLSFDDSKKQTNLRKNQILECPILLPSVYEQKHIVQKIESSFLKLDKIKKLNIKNQENFNDLNKIIIQEMIGKSER